MQELDNFLKDADKVRVSIPELDLLRHFHSDACSWSHEFHNILDCLLDREDHENVVSELSEILKSGQLLKVEGASYLIYLFQLISYLILI